MTAHSHAIRALVGALSLSAVALGAGFSFTPEADAAKPRLVRDWCTQTSGGGEGLECNSEDDLLIRTQNEDGTCGHWVCCPPNGDGTYDCNRGSSPGRTALNYSVLNNAIGNATVSGATTTTPGQTVNQNAAQRARNAQRFRRSN